MIIVRILQAEFFEALFNLFCRLSAHDLKTIRENNRWSAIYTE